MQLPKSVKRILLPCFFLLLGITALSNRLDKIFSVIGLHKISDSTNRYLETSFDKSVKGFLVLSTIKSGIAVLEGSEIGVGFKVEIGDLVQSIYDFVDIAWKASLAGSTILLLMRLIFITIGEINHYALALLLFFSAVLFSLPKSGNRSNKLGLSIREIIVFLSVLVIILYVILPLSVSGAAFLSKQITRPLVEEATLGFSSLQDDFSTESLSKRLFEPNEREDLLGSLNIPRRLHDTKERIKETCTWLKKKTKDMSLWTIKLVAGYIFDCIIFPFVLFFILFSFSKGILRYIFGLRRDKTFKEDFVTILKKYKETAI